MWCDNRLLLFGVLLLTFLVQAHITAAANSKEDEFAEFDRDPDAQEEEDDTEVTTFNFECIISPNS